MIQRSCSTFAALALALIPVGQGGSTGGALSSGGPCPTGPTSGLWELPDTPIGGLISGKIYAVDGATVLYDFTGVLNDVQTPCLSCREGFLQGYLDDGIGPGPDFEVHGQYFGLWLSGQGTFTAQILEPVGPALIPVGRMVGQYQDPPGPGYAPGSFSGRWGICP